MGVTANFLCGNVGYLLRINNKGNFQWICGCFDAVKSLHNRLLADASFSSAWARSLLFPLLGTGYGPRAPYSVRASGIRLLWRKPDLPHAGRLRPQSDPAIQTAWDAPYQAEGDVPQGASRSPDSWGRQKVSIAAFAYTSALNALLADRRYVFHTGVLSRRASRKQNGALCQSEYLPAGEPSDPLSAKGKQTAFP